MQCKVIALIVAGGSSRRFASKVPKQYLRYKDKPIIAHTIERFLMHPQIDQVKVVIRPEDLVLYKDAVKTKDILPPAYGGPERQDSVRLGLESIAELNPEIVLIHDACRPFINDQVINEIIEALKYCQGAIAATAATDTIKMVDTNDNKIIKTVNRKLIFHAQTPQGFRFKEILRLHKLAADRHFTDDAAIFEAYDKSVKIILSSRSNIKITMPEDMPENAYNGIHDAHTEVCPLAKYAYMWYLLEHERALNC